MELYGWLKIRIHGQLRYRNLKASEVSALNHILSYLCQHSWIWSCFIKKKCWFQGFQVSKTSFKRILAFPKHKLKLHFFKSSHISIFNAPIYFSFTLIGIPLRQPRGKVPDMGEGRYRLPLFLSLLQTPQHHRDKLVLRAMQSLLPYLPPKLSCSLP